MTRRVPFFVHKYDDHHVKFGIPPLCGIGRGLRLTKETP